MITIPDLHCEVETLRKSLAALKTQFTAAQAALPTSGATTLVAGTVDIADEDITPTSKVFVSYQGTQDTPGFLNVTLDDGVKFTITSSDTSDVSDVIYLIYH